MISSPTRDAPNDFSDDTTQLLSVIEQAVAAECVGADPFSAIEQCLGVGLDPAHFFTREHGTLFDLVLGMYRAGEVVDALTVAEEAVRRGVSSGRTATQYAEWLFSLRSASYTVAHVAQHSRILINHARKRQLAADARQAQAEANDPTLSPDVVIQRQIERVFAYRADAVQQGLRWITPRDWAEFSEPDGVAGLVFSGWPEVDRFVGGFGPGQLVVIGGAPKGGKTITALNIAKQAAMYDGHPVAIFSGEMTTREVGRRLLGSLANVPSNHYRRPGRLSDSEGERTARTLMRIATSPHQIGIDDSARPSVLHIVTQTLLAKRAIPTLAAVVVDFLQLVQLGAGATREREHERLKEISERLKGLAKEAGVVVFAPTQLNFKDMSNKSTGGPMREPILADLQGSSGMAQAADYVFLLHQPVPAPGDAVRLKLICAANRHGGTFASILGWNPDTATIFSLEPTD